MFFRYLRLESSIKGNCALSWRAESGTISLDEGKWNKYVKRMDSPRDQADTEFTERLLSREPIIVRRRVQWGECDPAGVVYTPRFADYMASAFMWFMRIVLWPALADETLRTPVKALSLEFHKTLKPEELFDMTVLVCGVRNRTFDLCIRGTGIEGDDRFTGKITPIIIKRDTFTSIELPSGAKELLLRYEQEFKQARLA
jgi:acyl-CoA thioesterase FadM